MRHKYIDLDGKRLSDLKLIKGVSYENNAIYVAGNMLIKVEYSESWNRSTVSEITDYGLEEFADIYSDGIIEVRRSKT